MPHVDGKAPVCLVIEASNPGIHAEVAFGLPAEPGRPSAVHACEQLRTVGRNEDDLLPAIERARAAASVTPSSIALVAVSVGPGGYTSLRVACAAAKIIAEAAGAPCVAIPTALVAVHATDAAQAAPHARVAVFLAGKDDTAYLTLFTPGSRSSGPVPAGRLCGATDLPAEQIDLAIGDRHIPAPIREALASRSIPLVTPRLSARACLDLVGRCERIDPVALAPLYPREPDAVTLWRQRRHGT